MPSPVRVVYKTRVKEDTPSESLTSLLSSSRPTSGTRPNTAASKSTRHNRPASAHAYSPVDQLRSPPKKQTWMGLSGMTSRKFVPKEVQFDERQGGFNPQYPAGTPDRIWPRYQEENISNKYGPNPMVLRPQSVSRSYEKSIKPDEEDHLSVMNNAIRKTNWKKTYEPIKAKKEKEKQDHEAEKKSILKTIFTNPDVFYPVSTKTEEKKSKLMHKIDREMPFPWR